jgi:hypothetical protein
MPRSMAEAQIHVKNTPTAADRLRREHPLPLRLDALGRGGCGRRLSGSGLEKILVSQPTP